MNAITLTIDGREVAVEPGQTILDAARQLGIDIPTLCFLEKCSPATSCLACLVKVKINSQARFVPSCATKAQPGMVLESETAEVHEARRTALELLLSDHVGDCLSPCHRICPLQLNIPVMLRQIENGQMNEAMKQVRQTLPLASVLARLCNKPCENGCRRGTADEPAAIRELERYAADASLALTQPSCFSGSAPTEKRVAIVGAGPAGLAASYFLRMKGHSPVVFDRGEKFGGTLRTVDAALMPPEILDSELELLRKAGVQFRPGICLGETLLLSELRQGFDAVLIATGEVEKEKIDALGVPVVGSGIKIESSTFQTSDPRVFAAGSAVKPIKSLVRALAEGKAVAESIGQFLNENKIRPREKAFSSMMGRVESSEVELFLNGCSRAARVIPSAGPAAGFGLEEAQAEAARCLHCDCRAAGNCKLQHYAQIYGAEPNRFRQQRRSFVQHAHPAGVIFEPGKCILCGICLQLAEQAREPLGLAFIGRGFNVRVGAPFNLAISAGLQKAAAECVENCPTGALSFRLASRKSTGQA